MKKVGELLTLAEEDAVLVKPYAVVFRAKCWVLLNVLVLNLCLVLFPVVWLSNQRSDHYKNEIQEWSRLERFKDYYDVDFERVSKVFVKMQCMNEENTLYKCCMNAQL